MSAEFIDSVSTKNPDFPKKFEEEFAPRYQGRWVKEEEKDPRAEYAEYLRGMYDELRERSFSREDAMTLLVAIIRSNGSEE